MMYEANFKKRDSKMKVYLIRHGETAWNHERRVQGRTNIPLNEAGEETARITGRGLQKEGVIFDRIFTSPLLRAYRTAELIKEETHSKCQIEKNDLLVEFGFGALEGMVIPEIGSNPLLAKYRDCFMSPETYQPEKGGESFDELLKRGERILNELIFPLEKSIPEGNLAVFCHGAIIRSILLYLKKLPLSEFWELSQLNCCVNCLEVRGGEARILFENRLFYEPAKDRRLGPTTMLRRGMYRAENEK